MYYSTYSPYTDSLDVIPYYNCMCIICLDDLNGNFDSIMTFRDIIVQSNKNTYCSCNCYCHDGCMTTWIEKNNSCPICRTKIIDYNNATLLSLI